MSAIQEINDAVCCLSKRAQEISYRPLPFFAKNKSAILAALTSAVAGASVGVLSGWKRKNRIKRAILGAVIGGSIGAVGGHVHDRMSFLERLKNGGKVANPEEHVKHNLSNLIASYLSDYFHNDLPKGKEPTPDISRHKGWNSNDSLLSHIPREEQIYDYALLRHADSKGTPVAVAFPKYDNDKVPAFIRSASLEKDDFDFIKIESPKGKAMLRALVNNNRPLTYKLLDEMKSSPWPPMHEGD